MTEQNYHMSQESASVFAKWPRLVEENRQASIALLRRWYPEMDAASRLRSARTLRVLESAKPMAWDGAA